MISRYLVISADLLIMYLHQKMHTYIIIEAAYGSHVVGMPVSIQRNYGFLYSGIPVSILRNRGVKSPGILNIKNAGNILQMLSKSVFGSLEPDKIELCFQIYFQTWIRCHTSMTPLFLKPEVIKNELYRKFLSVQPEIVNKCVDNSLAIVYSYEPELKQIVDMMNLFESNVAQNAEKNKRS